MRHMGDAVSLVGVVCDGSNHGFCEAACQTIWRSAWLRRVQCEVQATTSSPSASMPLNTDTVLSFGTEAPRYVCQLTQLHVASRPIEAWSISNFVLPLIVGNVRLVAFVVGWLTYVFDEVQHKRQGTGFPAFEATGEDALSPESTPLQPGDEVSVRSSAAIRSTLNDQTMHKGLWFEPDMLKHCGLRYQVEAEVTRLIDIVSGEMRTMKTPAYILKGVRFSGERQLFNAQCEPLFWRAVWLRRADRHPSSPGSFRGAVRP